MEQLELITPTLRKESHLLLRRSCSVCRGIAIINLTELPRDGNLLGYHAQCRDCGAYISHIVREKS